MTNHRRYIRQGNALYRISETGFYVNKRPSMKRRMIGHDYTKRGRYLITLVVDGRRPLLGRLEGPPMQFLEALISHALYPQRWAKP